MSLFFSLFFHTRTGEAREMTKLQHMIRDFVMEFLQANVFGAGSSW